MITKILLTGDLLRLTPDEKHSDQNTNIVWLYRLLKHQLTTATNLEVELLNTQTKNHFDTRTFYQLNNLKPTPANWIKIYNATPTPEALEYMQRFFQDTLVIGFELPSIFINALEKLQIPYIDAIIHPIRYMDDILLAFRTSQTSIYNQLKKFQTDQELYYIHASIHAAGIAKMKNLNLKPNSMLFTGQVDVDKSLISGDKLITIQEYADTLSALSKEYTHIYVKPHPYAKDNDKLKRIFNALPNVSYTDQNIYYLLAQDEIKALYSISSSTVFEAKYWGKKGEYLYQNPFYIDHENRQPNSKEYISLQDAFLTTSFWSEILADVTPTKKVQSPRIAQKTNRLRNTLQNYWGYNFLDTDILLKSYDLYTDQEQSVAQILQEIQPQVARKRETLEQKLRKSKTFRTYTQKVKNVPILGKFLYFVKHKILRWH